METASDLIAQAAGRRLVYLTDDMLAALPYSAATQAEAPHS